MQHPLTPLHDLPPNPPQGQSVAVVHNIGDTDWNHCYDLVAIVRTTPGPHTYSRAVPYATGAIHWPDGTAEGFYAPLNPDGSPLVVARWHIPAQWFLMAFHATHSGNAGRLDNLIALKAQDLHPSPSNPLPRFIDLP